MRRTTAVEELLRTIHPHYFSTKNYQYFIVLTQSCDLVKRNDAPCKSRYVTIAAVRPLRIALSREIENLQYTEIERRLRFCSAERQTKLIQFMERLLNNNSADYFYLHREPGIKLNEDHCAFLHLCITVKSRLHYQTLLDARIVSLTQPFQHKLGYLVGTLYSRIGTDDWAPDNCSEEQFKLLSKTPIEDPELVLWLEKDIYKNVLKQLQSVPDSTLEDLKKAIQTAQKSRDNKKASVLGIITNELRAMNIDEPTAAKITKRLENRPDFTAALR